MNRFVIAFLILGSLITTLMVPAFAVHGGDVIIGQEVVLRIRFPAGGYSVEQRAEIITTRINNLLGSKPFNPSDVKVAKQHGEYVVLVGDTLIITADRETAAFNRTTPEQLASIWANNIRNVIPRAKAEPTR